MLLKILKFVFPVFFCISTVYSQAPSIEWQKCYGGTENQFGYCIQQTNDGGYITCGTTYITASGDNYWIVKLDATGTVLWQKSLGGSGNELCSTIRQTSDGGYIAIGWTTSNDGQVTNFHGFLDCWIVKLNSAGDITWQKTFGGTGYDIGWDIQQTTDGGYIVSGETNSSNGDLSALGNHGLRDYWILKLDNLGNIVWQKLLGGSNEDLPKTIHQTPDGGYIVTGVSFSFDGDVTNPAHSMCLCWIVKLNSIGNIVWEKTYGSVIGGEYSMSLCLTNDGGYAFSAICVHNGSDVTGNHGLADFWVVKLDAAGDIEWQKSLGGSHNDEARTIIQSTDGGFVVAGLTRSGDGDVTGFHSDVDSWIVKLSSTGSLLWQKALGGSGTDEGMDVRQTTDGAYIIAGQTTSDNTGDVGSNPGAPSSDMWIVKLAPDLVPVTITSFTALAKSKDVLCNWQTQQEHNSSHFIIERSDDDSHFVPVGRIAAARNSSIPIDYNFTDEIAFITGKEYLYYRLKMVDLDAKFKYSNIVKVNLKYSSAISIYPNPVVDMLTVNFMSRISEEALITIIDHVGKKVYQKRVTIKQGRNIIPLNTVLLSEGAYILSVNGENNYLARFIKEVK